MNHNLIDLSLLYMELFWDALYNNPPRKACLQLTLNCNCRCQMCNFWKNGNYTDPPLLLVKNIVRSLKRTGVRRIWLWGGEPYLHKDFVEIAAFIKENRIECGVITNGISFNEETLKASAKFLDEITFSIDSPLPEVHDKIRGRIGTLDIALSNLERLIELRGKSIKPYINIDATLQKDNISHIEKMIDLSQKYNAMLSIDAVQLQGYGNEQTTALLDIPEEIIKEKMALLKDYSKKVKKMNSAAHIELMEDYFLKKKLKVPCFFPYIGMLLDPHGFVKLCWGWDKPIGNILDDGFLENWRSRKEGQVRKEIIQNRIARCKSCNFYFTRWPEKIGHYALKALFLMRIKLGKY